MQFADNRVLFGPDPTGRIVAVELTDDREVTVYRRREDGGATLACREPFTPFFWLAGEPPAGASQALAVRALSGDLHFNRLATVEGWTAFSKIRAKLRAQAVPHFALSDPVQQYLTMSGRTLFKGMDFGELRRMQIGIETFRGEGFEVSNCDRAEDHLMAIAVSDQSGWEELILVDRANIQTSERAAWERLGVLIRDRDPDVIEGHNIFKFDLPCLAERARQHRLKLPWGRDGTPLTSRQSRIQIAERTINYPKFEARGRHIVDTYLLVQLYDIGTRDLEGFGLKQVARYFNIAGGGEELSSSKIHAASLSQTTPGGTYLEGTEIQRAYLTDPARFAAYALDDVRETRALSALLSQSYFVQAQIFPFNYQEVIVRGNATRIDALFLREYYQRGHSIPDFPEARAFEGGYTDIFATGIKHNVWHCDVASLYPSVMLQYGIFPANDRLGIFRHLLSDLRAFRLRAKTNMRESAGDPARAREYRTLNALQNVFKILINSFYGYLGFAQGHFADYEAAARVTEAGRDLLKKMVAWLRDQAAEVIEIDTDGIYFTPPPGATVVALQEGLTAILPAGIEVEFDANYKSMFSYKAKNYALLDDTGRLVLKGGALKSRGLEKFQRDYLEQMIRFLLEGKEDQVARLRDEFEARIRQRAWPIEQLAKTDTLQDSLAQYQKKISVSARNRSAAYELALRSGRAYQPGDQISYYITGSKRKVSAYENAKLASAWRAEERDENIEYYVDKLNELAEKYAEFTAVARPATAEPQQGELAF